MEKWCGGSVVKECCGEVVEECCEGVLWRSVVEKCGSEVL